MRRLLGVLRDDDEPRELAPQPGPRASSTSCSSSVRSAGLPVSYEVSGAPDAPLPAGLRARRLPDRPGGADQHAQARRARARRAACAMRYGDDALEVEVATRRRPRDRAAADGSGAGCAGCASAPRSTTASRRGRPAPRRRLARPTVVLPAPTPATRRHDHPRSCSSTTRSCCGWASAWSSRPSPTSRSSARPATAREAVALVARAAARRRADGRPHARHGRHRGHPRASSTAAARSRVIILTTFDLDEYAYAALRAGASGFLLKDAPARRPAVGDPRGGQRRRGRRAEHHPAAAGDDRAPAARSGATPRRRPTRARRR